MTDGRTCENCHCFENCTLLNSFCRQMVFRMRRIDITFIDNLAENCKHFMLSIEPSQDEIETQPFLFLVKS